MSKPIACNLTSSTTEELPHVMPELIYISLAKEMIKCRDLQRLSKLLSDAVRLNHTLWISDFQLEHIQLIHNNQILKTA